MLKKYNNIYVDTAFVSIDTIRKIIADGFALRVILGSDFPITHYRENAENTYTGLQNYYTKDLKKLKEFSLVCSQAAKPCRQHL